MDYFKKRMLACLLALVIGLSPSVMTGGAVYAGEAADLPEGGRDLFADTYGDLIQHCFKTSASFGTYAAWTDVRSTNPAFSMAKEIQTKSLPPSESNVQIYMSFPEDLKAGDSLVFTYWLRTAECDEAYVRLNFEQNSSPYTKALSVLAHVSREEGWKQVVYAVTLEEDIPKDTYKLDFACGYMLQTVDIGGLRVIHYGQGVDIADIPQTPKEYYYRGMEESAPWRDEAEARIEELRKGDLIVTVIDAEGRPIEGAAVNARLTRHAFDFGTSVTGRWPETSADGTKIRNALRTYFNMGTPESRLKWPSWESDPDLGLKMVDWMELYGLKIRGHNLIWDDADRFMPDDLEGLLEDYDALDKRISDHIADEAGTLAGRIYQWDVLNEPTEKNDIQTRYGLEEAKKWFDLAKAADPDAKLFVNDYVINGVPNESSQRFMTLLDTLLEMGAPIDGVGIQSHHYGLVEPMAVYDQITEITDLGVEAAITEFGIYLEDEEYQKKFTHDMMLMAFSHPGVTGFSMWGFWDGAHFENNSPLFRRDWSLKPSGEEFIRLTTQEWSTDTDGVTGPDGKAVIRGFKGDYEITVTCRGKTVIGDTVLDETGAVTMVVDGFTDDAYDETVIYQSRFDTAAGVSRNNTSLQITNADDGTDDWTAYKNADYSLGTDDAGVQYLQLSATDAADPYLHKQISIPAGTEKLVLSAKVGLFYDSTVANVSHYGGFDLRKGNTSIVRLMRLGNPFDLYGIKETDAMGFLASGSEVRFEKIQLYTPGDWVDAEFVIENLDQEYANIQVYVNGERLNRDYGKIRSADILEMDRLYIQINNSETYRLADISVRAYQRQEDLRILSDRFELNGKPTQTIGQGTLSAIVEIDNNLAQFQKAALALAVYDGKILQKLELLPETELLPGVNEIPLSVEVERDYRLPSAKLFVWKDMDTLASLAANMGIGK